MAKTEDKAFPAKIVWLTGATGGIGRELAAQLAARGATVAATARNPGEIEALAAGAERIRAYPGDVTAPAMMSDAVGRIEAELGPIDMAILGAGVYTPFDIRRLDLDGFHRTFDVNVMGVANGIAAVLPKMLERRTGRLVVMGSAFGWCGLPGNGAYGASKAAIINLCESLRHELEGTGVSITIVNPGFIDTALNASYDRPKPYVMRPQKAARRIVEGLEKGGYEIAFPRKVTEFLKSVRFMPWAVAKSLVRRAMG
jgi:short-subunit dehydrogenase